MRFTVDSDASINVIGEPATATLKIKSTLAKASTKNFPYASDTPMTTLGVFHAEIASARKLAEAKIYVVKGFCGSLLSYKTGCDLGLMKINANALHSCTSRRKSKMSRS